MISPKLTSILIPVDSCPESESILPALLPLFHGRPTEVVLLQVAATPEGVGASTRALEGCAAKLRAKGVRVRVEVAHGRAVDRILELSAKLAPDFLAMGTHGRQGPSRATLGSVAEDVVCASPVPVLLCRPDTQIRDWKRILVPLDGTPEAEAALPDATALARALGATLHLVRVRLALVQDEGFRGLHYNTPCTDPAPYLDTVRERLAGEGFLVKAELREGIPAEQILKAAEDGEVGLLCLATEGGPVSELSVAAEVIRKASCPVLVRTLTPCSGGKK